jgi:negative regulator of genetic competence, sporulation and motility
VLLRSNRCIAINLHMESGDEHASAAKAAVPTQQQQSEQQQQQEQQQEQEQEQGQQGGNYQRIWLRYEQLRHAVALQ